MKLQKVDVAVWVKCSDDLPEKDGLYLIVDSSPSGINRHEMYFKTEDKKWYWQPNPYSVCGHGFITEWLKPLPDRYLLTEDEIIQLLVEFFNHQKMGAIPFLKSITNGK